MDDVAAVGALGETGRAVRRLVFDQQATVGDFGVTARAGSEGGAVDRHDCGSLGKGGSSNGSDTPIEGTVARSQLTIRRFPVYRSAMHGESETGDRNG